MFYIKRRYREGKHRYSVAEPSDRRESTGGAACLLINAPTSDISETEKDAVIEYLENGGKAMIFSDYTEEGMTNFDAILANYGVQRTEGVVVEGDSQHYAQMPYYLVPTVNSTDAITDFASKGYYVLMPTAQGIQKTDDVRDTVTIESLLTTSDSAYSKVDVNSGSIEKQMMISRDHLILV